MSEARVRVSLTDGVLEFEGSEHFRNAAVDRESGRTYRDSKRMYREFEFFSSSSSCSSCSSWASWLRNPC